ncbi:MAG: hypothetical protein VX876_07930 [Planctomycetota bacterium]|nr:hypothetical protein [Planctomycetota bacterium]
MRQLRFNRLLKRLSLSLLSIWHFALYGRMPLELIQKQAGTVKTINVLSYFYTAMASNHAATFNRKDMRGELHQQL